jgi:hypothetical protein
MSDIPFRLGQLEDEVPQPQGNIIHAAHTEPPRLHFVVGFDAAPYRNVLRFAATQRRIFVLAETEEGAISVARYHYGRRGSNFRVVGPTSCPRPGHEDPAIRMYRRLRRSRALLLPLSPACRSRSPRMAYAARNEHRARSRPPFLGYRQLDVAVGHGTASEGGAQSARAMGSARPASPFQIRSDVVALPTSNARYRQRTLAVPGFTHLLILAGSRSKTGIQHSRLPSSGRSSHFSVPARTPTRLGAAPRYQ